MGILRRSTALIACLGLPTALAAQDYPLTRDDITPKREYHFDLPSGEILASPGHQKEYRDMAEEIGRHSTEMTMKALREQGLELGVLPDGVTPSEQLANAPGIQELPEGFRASILISKAMGDGAITALLDQYRMRKDVRFVFRGVPNGWSVPEFALWLRDLSTSNGSEIQDLNITIDPELFEVAAALMAPTLLLEDLNSQDASLPTGMDVGKIVARAEGITDAKWVHDQMLKGRTSENGPNVVEIEEEDLRTRAAREAEGVAAGLTTDPAVLSGRYWDRTGRALRNQTVLPATANRTRQLHFLFQTSEAITDHQGKILAHAGEVFQPKEVLPFDRRIFVFNPNIPKQVDFVEAQIATSREGVNRTMLIVTEIPNVSSGQQPWDGLQSVIDRFGMQVFVLNDQFKSAFKIEASPTEIYPLRTGPAVEVISEEYAIQ